MFVFFGKTGDIEAQEGSPATQGACNREFLFFKGLAAIDSDTSWQKIYGPNFQQMTPFHLSEYRLAKWG